MFDKHIYILRHKSQIVLKLNFHKTYDLIYSIHLYILFLI